MVFISDVFLLKRSVSIKMFLRRVVGFLVLRIISVWCFNCWESGIGALLR